MPEPLITFDNVTVLYERRRPHRDVVALNAISFDVVAGESVGIIGNSGAGKSTLCRVAEGLVRPISGRIVVDGVDLNSCAAAGLATGAPPHFSRLPGCPRLFQSEAAGRRFGWHGAAQLRRRDPAGLRHAVGEALERVGLPASQMTRYPHEFSGGQIQRTRYRPRAHNPAAPSSPRRAGLRSRRVDSRPDPQPSERSREKPVAHLRRYQQRPRRTPPPHERDGRSLRWSHRRACPNSGALLKSASSLHRIVACSARRDPRRSHGRSGGFARARPHRRASWIGRSRAGAPGRYAAIFHPVFMGWAELSGRTAAASVMKRGAGQLDTEIVTRKRGDCEP